MASLIHLGHDELEARFHRLLGQFFVAFARVELNLALRVGGDGKFHEKLERLLRSSIRFADNEEAYCQIAACYMGADSLREVRNLLAHGRWGCRVPLQQVVHVSGYPPGPQVERCFSLGDLERIVRDTESLCKQLGYLPADLFDDRAQAG